MNTMTTEQICEAYDAQVKEETATIAKKTKKIQEIAGEREKAISRKEKIEEIKKKIMEKRKLMKEKTEIDANVKRTLKEADGDDEDYDIEDEDDIEIEDEDGVEDEVEEELPKLESKQAILKKIAERKRADILKKIAERKQKAEGAVEIEEKVGKEKKEVRVGTLLEAAEGDKKRRFSVYKEEKNSFYLKELGTGKTFRIAKEKVELTD